MNKVWIQFHLREALEALIDTIAKIEADPDYDETNFEVEMAHLYNHVNTAWNSRNADAQCLGKPSSAEAFYRWRAFPSDLPMGRP